MIFNKTYIAFTDEAGNFRGIRKTKMLFKHMGIKIRVVITYGADGFHDIRKNDLLF